MHLPAWEEIERFYNLPGVAPEAVRAFRHLRSDYEFHTKGEGNPHHYCVFFLPYHQASGRIYLGHHRKANDWIPPGGHLEPGETPTAAATREMKEELDYDLAPGQLIPFDLSVKPIGRAESGCLTHHDVWYLVDSPLTEFRYLPSEYYDARWFTVADGVREISRNPDFAQIVTRLQPQ